jgi:hypothetical protein
LKPQFWWGEATDEPPVSKTEKLARTLAVETPFGVLTSGAPSRVKSLLEKTSQGIVLVLVLVLVLGTAKNIEDEDEDD